MLDAGRSDGAALGFLIAGAGSSPGAIAGLLTIARWRVIAVVVGTLWVSAVLFGAAYTVLCQPYRTATPALPTRSAAAS
jgi:hypothetical protein